MAIDERHVVPPAGDGSPAPPEQHYAGGDRASLKKIRKQTLGIGLLKGMAVTIKHLFKRNTVIQYPDEMQDLSPRTRGVIALKEENCTVCMLCARECPDWCIYIDSHKEQLPPKRAGGRQRKRNVLDRFAIDYALCMYCGICVEVCPYDALFWSPDFEYSEFDIRELTHEKERLSDWMSGVKPPAPLEVGALQPGQPEPSAPEAPETPAGGAGPGSAQRPSPPSADTAAAESPEQAERQPEPAATAAPTPDAATQSQDQAGETEPAEASAAPGTPTESRADEKAPAKKADEPAKPDEPDEPAKADKADEPAKPDKPDKPAEADKPDKPAEAATPAGPAKPPEPAPSDAPTPNVEVPIEEPKPVALEKTEDPQAVHDEVLKEQLAKGSSPQVAEARAKVARVKAERGIKRGPTPVETEKRVPSAPTKGQPPEPEPGGAPEAKTPEPDPGPVAPTEDEDDS